MDLTPRERDQLLVFTAALLAERRRARGLRLNLPEAQALIAAAVFEGAREGKGVEQVAAEAGRLLVRADVMDGVAENLGEIRVEATFTDGLRLVTLQRPIA
ncbi:MAG: urease subunit gamma [Rubrivivax sp.]